MSTWNRKAREQSREMQIGMTKRQVLCAKCRKTHDHPVCDSVRAKYIAQGKLRKDAIARRARREKALRREEQRRNLKLKFHLKPRRK